MPLKNITFDLGHITLSALASYTDDSSQPVVLCLHGWMDNAASFIPLIEKINLPDYQLVAIDLAGHGMSDHRSEGVFYQVWDYSYDVVKLIQMYFAGREVILLGHSLGAAISLLVSSIFPELITRIIALDNLIPLSNPDYKIKESLRDAFMQQRKMETRSAKLYSDKALMIHARMMGIGGLTYHSAELLVDRQTKKVDDGYVWTFDQRLKIMSPLRLTDSHIMSLLSSVSIQIDLILGREGLFKKPYRLFGQIAAYNMTVASYWLEGGHHFHMEGDVEGTARLIEQLLDIT